MPRPFTRAQALQNRAFLAAVRRTGNVRLAARELGVHRSTFTKRRGKDAAFATANGRLSAAAAGFSHASFYARARRPVLRARDAARAQS